MNKDDVLKVIEGKTYYCTDYIYFLYEELRKRDEIIKEVREYIETKYDYLLGNETFLDHDEIIDRKQIKHILEILDKENKE